MRAGQEQNSEANVPSTEDSQWTDLKHGMNDITDVVFEQGRNLAQAAREQVSAYAQERKSDLAQSVADFAGSLRESTQSFEGQPSLRAVTDIAVDGLEQIADNIEDFSFSDVWSDFENLARKRPFVVITASLAVGFLAARFIKSTATARENDTSASPKSQKKTSSQRPSRKSS